jgi:hypothetical protein
VAETRVRAAAEAAADDARVKLAAAEEAKAKRKAEIEARVKAFMAARGEFRNKAAAEAAAARHRAAAAAREDARLRAATAAAATADALQLAGAKEAAVRAAAVARHAEQEEEEEEEEVILEKALDPDEVMAQSLASAQAAGLVGQYMFTPGRLRYDRGAAALGFSQRFEAEILHTASNTRMRVQFAPLQPGV